MGEFEASKEAMGRNIILNSFDVTRRIVVITDASADKFGHILMQKRNESEVMVKAQRGNREGVITDHSPLAQAMKKEVRELTPRMQKFREAILAYNVTVSFVKDVHNHIGDALLRSPVGGVEEV